MDWQKQLDIYARAVRMLRSKTLQDVRGILWVQRGRLDLDYLRRWSERSLEVKVQQELERLIDDYSRNQ